MPWLETWPMDQRVDFVREYASGFFTMTELAAQYGISRKTGYKWLGRHDDGGGAGLAGSLAAAAPQPAGHGGGAAGGADRRAETPSALGREETPDGRRPATRPRPRGRVRPRCRRI